MMKALQAAANPRRGRCTFKTSTPRLRSNPRLHSVRLKRQPVPDFNGAWDAHC